MDLNGQSTDCPWGLWTPESVCKIGVYRSLQAPLPAWVREDDPGRSACTVPEGQSPTAPSGDPSPANPHHLPTLDLPPTAPTSVNGAPIHREPWPGTVSHPELLNWTCPVCLPPKEGPQSQRALLPCFPCPMSMEGIPGTGAEVRSPGRPEQGDGGTLGQQGVVCREGSRKGTRSEVSLREGEPSGRGGAGLRAGQRGGRQPPTCPSLPPDAPGGWAAPGALGLPSWPPRSQTSGRLQCPSGQVPGTGHCSLRRERS